MGALSGATHAFTQILLIIEAIAMASMNYYRLQQSGLCSYGEPAAPSNSEL